jgi:hypothetical protein
MKIASFQISFSTFSTATGNKVDPFSTFQSAIRQISLQNQPLQTVFVQAFSFYNNLAEILKSN